MRNGAILLAAILVAMTVIGGPTAALDTQGPNEGAMMALQLDCNDATADVRSMEHEYLEQGCWGHMGYHTYFMGHDAVYDLHAGDGRVFSVEQQLSPPIERLILRTDPLQLFTPLPLETSRDGIEWKHVADVDYKFVGLAPGGTSMRQEIEFSFEADAEPFQYLRIRQPLSAAQGLSGYLDATRLTIQVTESTESPAPAQGAALRSCDKHIMEAVWDAHPCWFGGINRWDTPSFFHTYPMGAPAKLDGVEGTALFAYWRPDDPGTCCGQDLGGMTGGPVFLQSSNDGIHWQTLGTFNATYGEPLEFSVELDGHVTGFLRLASDKHPGYWEHPALKRPEAYLLQSELRLTATPIE